MTARERVLSLHAQIARIDFALGILRQSQEAQAKLYEDQRAKLGEAREALVGELARAHEEAVRA